MSIESINTAADSKEFSLLGQTEVVFQKPSQKQLALQDMLDSLRKWRIWLLLAYQDIRLRYRRSVLGPLWITISMAITVYSMGYLYGHLFRSNIASYFPFLVGGMLAWNLLSTTLTDLVETLVISNGMIKQIKLPYSLYINRVVARNMIIFFHNLLVIIPIMVVFPEAAKINFYTLLLIPGLFFTYINAVTYGLVISMLGARFRDITQLIRSITQVIFFVTPVMWKPDVLPPDKRYIALLNPFYSFIEIIRSPMIGTLPSVTNMVVVLVMTVIGMGISFKILTRYRARIVYWL